MSNVAQDFYCGKYADVLRVLGRAPLFKKPNKAEWPIQIAALVFTGEMLEALSLFDLALKQKNLSEDSLLQARFFIGVGLVRVSRYSDAKKEFAINLNLYRKIRKKKKFVGVQGFYAFQGAAFYHFFKAQYKVSKSLANKAYQAAFESEMLFGQAFSLELMGHCHCQLGEVHRGIQDFNKAISCTDKIGNGGLSSAFVIAREKFKAHYGIDFKNVEKNLYRAIRTLKPEDTYSRTELCLELSRQLILRGKVTEAKTLLDENAEIVYRHQNRRQSALFNLRYSYILYLQGEMSAALTLLRSSKANLVPEVDLFYLRQLLGLESKILFEHYPNQKTNISLKPFVNFVDERIYSRTHKEHKVFINTAEDFVGDLIDAAEKSIIDVSELLKIGILGLVPKALKQKSSSSFILLGPTKGELVVHSKGDVLWVQSGMTKPFVKILFLLEGGTVLSKEKLVQEVWGYEYRSDRHDSLLHASIAKLRKLLGVFASWIEWSSSGYRLRADIKIISHSTAHILKDVAIPQRILEVDTANRGEGVEFKYQAATTSDLNARQVRLIKSLGDGSFIGVTDYSKTYRVCKMTACRDLTTLWKRNILKKYGRARATQYRLRGIKDEN